MEKTMAELKNTSFNKNFDSVFCEITHDNKLNITNNNCLRMFCLDVQNCEFDYSGLHQILQKNIGRYVFSRASIDKFTKEDDVEAIGLKAIELLRDVSSEKDQGAGGELGEVLLYLFLEQKLNAPKLLSKVELKTAKNQYVFGSDGVHLLSAGDKDYQLVLGESKIKGDINGAIDDAFVSINKVAKDPSNEIRLIDKNILSEEFDEETKKFIEALIVPQKRDRNYNLDKAFGVFIGYSISLEKAQYTNNDYKDALKKQLENDVFNTVKHIEKKIKESGLVNYSFYFYFLPFDDAMKDRREIMKKIKGDS